MRFSMVVPVMILACAVVAGAQGPTYKLGRFPLPGRTPPVRRYGGA